MLFEHLLALDTLQLLVVLPLNSINGTEEIDGWERGTEMLITAERAVESINQDTGILQGYRLELSVIDSMMCRPPHHRVTVLPQFLDALFHSRQEVQVIGAVGMFCYSTAHLFTQLAKRPHRKNLTFPFFMGTSSPIVNVTGFPFSLFRMLDSSLAIVRAVVSFLEFHQWTRVAVITDLQDTYYSQTAQAFLNNIKQNPNISVSLYSQVQGNVDLKGFDANVIFVSASVGVSRQIMEMAKNASMMWPSYAWIFHTHAMQDFSINTGTTYLNGLFLFQDGQLKPKADCRVVQLCNPYANILHKTIMLNAFIQNMSLLDAGLDYITALRRISSQGLVEDLAFDGDTHTLFSTGVDIVQVADGLPVRVGHYDSQLAGNLTITNDSIKNNRILQTTVYRSPVVIVLVLYYVEIVLCSILVTVDLLLFIYYRKEPEVKATSFSVSIFMFLSSYALILYLVLLAAKEQLVEPSLLSDVICIARSWLNMLSIPGSLILSTILIKMLRVYQIFLPNNLRRTGKFCTDPAIFCYIFLLQLPNVIVVILWSALDPYKNEFMKIQETNSIRLVDKCFSHNLSLWPTLLLVYNFTLNFILAIVAIKTRKIRKCNFKDTKKVNVFVFMSIFLVVLLLILWLTARELSMVSYGEVALHFGHSIMVFLVQALLFIPKLYPAVKRDVRKCLNRNNQFKIISSANSTNSTLSMNYTTLSKQHMFSLESIKAHIFTD